MAYTTIDDPSAYFQSILWTGNDTDGRALTNDGNSDLQPDLVWLKNRDVGYNHIWTDSTRGVTKNIYSNSDGAEATVSNKVESFDTNGFTVGYDGSQVPNKSPRTFVAWQWKANGGTTSSNTDGSITSTVQANTDAGFSIVTYTGTGSAATVGHGLGVAPKFYVVKNRNNTGSTDWTCYHEGLTSNQYFLYLNSTAGQSNSVDFWNSTSPTSSVFSIKSGSDNVSNAYNYVAYCFAEKQGYSKFGKYTGGGGNSPFVYTGFKPALVICKRTDSTNDWGIVDSKRETYNGATKTLFADLTNAESSTYTVDLLSNGFRPASNHSIFNQNGGSYIYMAFAENPFVTSTGIPTTAR